MFVVQHEILNENHVTYLALKTTAYFNFWIFFAVVFLVDVQDFLRTETLATCCAL